MWLPHMTLCLVGGGGPDFALPFYEGGRYFPEFPGSLPQVSHWLQLGQLGFGLRCPYQRPSYRG